MALEIIVRKRRSDRPSQPDSRLSDPVEGTKQEDLPANDNEGAWPFIPFPDGSF